MGPSRSTSISLLAALAAHSACLCAQADDGLGCTAVLERGLVVDVSAENRDRRASVFYEGRIWNEATDRACRVAIYHASGELLADDLPELGDSPAPDTLPGEARLVWESVLPPMTGEEPQRADLAGDGVRTLLSEGGANHAALGIATCADAIVGMHLVVSAGGCAEDDTAYTFVLTPEDSCD